MSPPNHILIVDDEPNVRLVFRTALETAGYHVSEVGGGHAALEALRIRRADLVLLDLRMPGLDGMEVLRRIRDAGDDVPVVIVTAHGSPPDVVGSMRLGATDFLPKPVTPANLREVVAGVLAGCGADDHGPAVRGAREGSRPDLFVEDLVRARRALDRHEVEDAEFFLRIADALSPGSVEVGDLRDALRLRRATARPITFRTASELTS